MDQFRIKTRQGDNYWVFRLDVSFATLQDELAVACQQISCALQRFSMKRTLCNAITYSFCYPYQLDLCWYAAVPVCPLLLRTFLAQTSFDIMSSITTSTKSSSLSTTGAIATTHFLPFLRITRQASINLWRRPTRWWYNPRNRTCRRKTDPRKRRLTILDNTTDLGMILLADTSSSSKLDWGTNEPMDSIRVLVPDGGTRRSSVPWQRLVTYI